MTTQNFLAFKERLQESLSRSAHVAHQKLQETNGPKMFEAVNAVTVVDHTQTAVAKRLVEAALTEGKTHRHEKDEKRKKKPEARRANNWKTRELMSESVGGPDHHNEMIALHQDAEKHHSDVVLKISNHLKGLDHDADDGGHYKRQALHDHARRLHRQARLLHTEALSNPTLNSVRLAREASKEAGQVSYSLAHRSGLNTDLNEDHDFFPCGERVTGNRTHGNIADCVYCKGELHKTQKVRAIPRPGTMEYTHPDHLRARLEESAARLRK